MLHYWTKEIPCHLLGTKTCNWKQADISIRTMLWLRFGLLMGFELEWRGFVCPGGQWVELPYKSRFRSVDIAGCLDFDQTDFARFEGGLVQKRSYGLSFAHCYVHLLRQSLTVFERAHSHRVALLPLDRQIEGLHPYLVPRVLLQVAQHVHVGRARCDLKRKQWM